ncbi:hypothetical protein NE235_21505 [Actinoallomurus spadix]|uniref:XRE family transcriptional regulator n=1 Tax=Actinoallomurus spadix TaxID=79912 RepID=A0ABP3H278_9ACTN|nr:hypothetical protein [Actinoallomurus spadix]MCO5988687.1 hypothetical protein [Actinoallomurus spadix]
MGIEDDEGEAPRIPRAMNASGSHSSGVTEFSGALRTAIQNSGLTLESLRTRLRQRGIRVSAATLSYWQGGRSRPQRPDSIAAVGVLEQILELPAGTLTDLLRPRRRRGQAGGGPLHPARLWSDPRPVLTMLGQLDRSSDHRLEWLAVHDVYEVGADRRPRSLVVRQVVRASGDDVDRVVAVHRAEAETDPPPALGDLRHCRRGRVRHEAGFIAFELFFDRVLARGDTAVVEYELGFPGDRPITRFHERRFRHSVKEYLAIVRFDRQVLPARCYRYDRDTVDVPRRRTAELWVGSSGGVHITRSGVAGGITGLEWEWE